MNAVTATCRNLVGNDERKIFACVERGCREERGAEDRRGEQGLEEGPSEPRTEGRVGARPEALRGSCWVPRAQGRRSKKLGSSSEPQRGGTACNGGRARRRPVTRWISSGWISKKAEVSNRRPHRMILYLCDILEKVKPLTRDEERG